MITTKTALLPYQEQAVEKLRGLKDGALYMEQGTGKIRTALEIEECLRDLTDILESSRNVLDDLRDKD